MFLNIPTMLDHVGCRYFFSRFVGSQLYFSPFVASHLTTFSSIQVVHVSPFASTYLLDGFTFSPFFAVNTVPLIAITLEMGKINN